MNDICDNDSVLNDDEALYFESIGNTKRGSLSPFSEDFVFAGPFSADKCNAKKLLRFARVNEKKVGDSLDALIEQLKHDINALEEKAEKSRRPVGVAEDVQIEPVNWFISLGHRFLKFEAKYGICNTRPYKHAQIYGIDASSAVAVVALNVEAGQHVLDFCCAPGAKLAMIVDTLAMRDGLANSISTVTGVDISSKRLAICKSLIRKYDLKLVRLFLDDACTFNVLAPDFDQAASKTRKPDSFPNVQFPEDIDQSVLQKLGLNPTSDKAKRRRKKKKYAGRLEKLYHISDWSWSQSSQQLYDRVLVDAQCTLDASLRHMIQYKKGIRYSDAELIQATILLQKRLIYNGFRLLKPGGTLVYSTCSYHVEQNEGVVKWLLQNERRARLSPIDWPRNMDVKVDEGLISGTVRFNPKTTETSGAFIARIKKQ